MEQQLKLSEEAFEVACTAQKRFAEGDPKTKKEILAAVQSNLTLKDKKLLFEAKKPFLILENTIYPEKPIISPIEPENIVVAQRQKTPTIFMRPYLLGDLDDVRTYSRKLSNHRYAIALFTAAYNFCKVHTTLGCTPAVGLKLATETWTIERLIEEITA